MKLFNAVLKVLISVLSIYSLSIHASAMDFKLPLAIEKIRNCNSQFCKANWYVQWQQCEAQAVAEFLKENAAAQAPKKLIAYKDLSASEKHIIHLKALEKVSKVLENKPCDHIPLPRKLSLPS